LCRNAAIAISILSLIAPLSSHAQSADEGDSTSTQTVATAGDSTSVRSLGMLMLLADERYRSGLMLSYSARSGIDTHALLGGYRLYRASAYEMALQGAGAGMTMGVAAGAFGMMTGAWDEREAWYIAGAAAAAGAIFGTVKSDDSAWNIRIRWDPDH